MCGIVCYHRQLQMSWKEVYSLPGHRIILVHLIDSTVQEKLNVPQDGNSCLHTCTLCALQSLQLFVTQAVEPEGAKVSVGCSCTRDRHIRRTEPQQELYIGTPCVITSCLSTFSLYTLQLYSNTHSPSTQLGIFFMHTLCNSLQANHSPINKLALPKGMKCGGTGGSR